MRKSYWLLVAISLLLATFLLNMSFGATRIPLSQIALAILRFDEASYDHYIIIFQRLPRSLIAIYLGAVMAVGGAVLQGLTRNPLASPALIGINSGVTLAVVASTLFVTLSPALLVFVAIGGGICGFFCVLAVARLIGLSDDPRSLSLILSGAVLSMLFVSIANALLLTQPNLRTEFLGWITGNINHVYANRLHTMWWIGVIGFCILFALSRPLTLIMLGNDKAASVGVNVPFVKLLALLTVVVSASSAVAICGPIGFVGLVVPHIVRPLIGANFYLALPANAIVGASVCLLADLAARTLFSPYVLHTGVMLDLVGGMVFAIIVKRFYLSAGTKTAFGGSV